MPHFLVIEKMQTARPKACLYQVIFTFPGLFPNVPDVDVKIGTSAYFLQKNTQTKF